MLQVVALQVGHNACGEADGRVALDKVQGGELCIVEDDVGGIGFGLA